MRDEFNEKEREIIVAVRTVRDAIPGYIDGIHAYLDAVCNDPTGFITEEVFQEYFQGQVKLYEALRALYEVRRGIKEG